MCWSFQFSNPKSRATSRSRGCINCFAYCMKQLVHSDKLATRYLRRLKTHLKVASNMWLLLEKLHFLLSYKSSMNLMTTFLDKSSRLGLSVPVLWLVHLRHGFGSRMKVSVPKRISASTCLWLSPVDLRLIWYSFSSESGSVACYSLMLKSSLSIQLVRRTEDQEHSHIEERFSSTKYEDNKEIGLIWCADFCGLNEYDTIFD